VPESFDAAVLVNGAREARAHYKSMFRDVDAAITEAQDKFQEFLDEEE